MGEDNGLIMGILAAGAAYLMLQSGESPVVAPVGTTTIPSDTTVIPNPIIPTTVVPVVTPVVTPTGQSIPSSGVGINAGPFTDMYGVTFSLVSGVVSKNGVLVGCADNIGMRNNGGIVEILEAGIDCSGNVPYTAGQWVPVSSGSLLPPAQPVSVPVQPITTQPVIQSGGVYYSGARGGPLTDMYGNVYALTNGVLSINGIYHGCGDNDDIRLNNGIVEILQSQMNCTGGIASNAGQWVAVSTSTPSTQVVASQAYPEPIVKQAVDGLGQVWRLMGFGVPYIMIFPDGKADTVHGHFIRDEHVDSYGLLVITHNGGYGDFMGGSGPKNVFGWWVPYIAGTPPHIV